MTEDEFYNVLKVGDKFNVTSVDGKFFRMGVVTFIVESGGDRIGFLVKINSADDPKAVGKFLPVSKDMALETSERKAIQRVGIH